MTEVNLILGGARSGKSRLAESRVLDLVNEDENPARQSPIYLATATAGDDEMRLRIRRHQEQRQQDQKQKAQWQTIEEPLALGHLINNLDQNAVVLVDCLTLWLSNCLHHECWQKEKQAFMEALQTDSSRKLFLVSNETGLGVVPMGQLSREFVDESGFLHQDIASFAKRVTLVVAGLPTELK